MPEMPVSDSAVGDLPLQAAAHWFVVLADADTPEHRRQWQLWHDAATAHQLAWQKVEKLQSLLAAAPRQTTHALRKRPRHARRQALGLLGVALVSALWCAFMPSGTVTPPVQWIATATGERRAVTLPDGGRLWLGSDTRIGIAYHAHGRDIYLTHGVLQLSSGSDAQRRPLRILARDGVLRPLGTRLTISQYGAHTVLAVQEHAVEVQPLGGPVVRVQAGQRVSFSNAGCGQPQATPVADDAWTRGLLMAIDMPLPEFAEQFSLYSGQPVAVARALSNRRVSGTYQIDSPASSLHTLADVLAVRLEQGADGWYFRPR